MFATTKSPFIWMCIYEGAVNNIGLYLALAKDGSTCLKLEPKISSFPVLEASVASSTKATAKRLFISSIVKKYKIFKHFILELFYSVIYYIHKGGMTNVKRKNKISIKSISS